MLDFTWTFNQQIFSRRTIFGYLRVNLCSKSTPKFFQTIEWNINQTVLAHLHWGLDKSCLVGQELPCASLIFFSLTKVFILVNGISQQEEKSFKTFWRIFIFGWSSAKAFCHSFTRTVVKINHFFKSNLILKGILVLKTHWF